MVGRLIRILACLHMLSMSLILEALGAVDSRCGEGACSRLVRVWAARALLLRVQHHIHRILVLLRKMIEADIRDVGPHMIRLEL